MYAAETLGHGGICVVASCGEGVFARRNAYSKGLLEHESANGVLTSVPCDGDDDATAVEMAIAVGRALMRSVA